MARIERIDSGGPLSADAEREADRKAEARMRKVSDAMRRSRIDWSPTAGSDQPGLEERLHHASATRGLKAIMAQAAADEARAAAGQKAKKTSRRVDVDEDGWSDA